MMKITKLAIAFVILIGAVSLQSCDIEPIDPALTSGVSNDTGNNGGSGDDGDFTGTGADSTGDYWPRAIGNFWKFDDSFYGDVTYSMIATEEINGQTYYQFDDLLNSEAWLLKTGDSYFIRTAIGGFDISGYSVSTTYITTKMLVDSAEEGDEWSSNVSYTISYTPTNPSYPEIPDVDYSAVYNFEMIARDLSRTVEGVEYDNVLQVRLTLQAEGSAGAVTDYYYAKDVGLIEFVGNISSGTLTSYNLN